MGIGKLKVQNIFNIKSRFIKKIIPKQLVLRKFTIDDFLFYHYLWVANRWRSDLNWKLLDNH